jgi:hypothetical protein
MAEAVVEAQDVAPTTTRTAWILMAGVEKRKMNALGARGM